MLPLIIILLLAPALRADDFVRIYKKGEAKPLVFSLAELDSVRFVTTDSEMRSGIIFGMIVDSVRQIFYSPDYAFRNPKQLTDASQSSGHAHWSPDGAKISFHRSRLPDYADDCWVMNSDGSNQVQITRKTPGCFSTAQTSWYPDGSRIIYAWMSNKWRDDEIRSVKLNGTGDSLVFSNLGDKDNWPALNPVKPNLLAYTYNEGWDNNTIHKEIRIRDLEEGIELTIPETKGNHLDEFELRWSTNGEMLLWTTSEVNKMRTVKVYSLLTKEVKVITDQFEGGGAAFTPDGKQILFSTNQNKRGRIYRCDLDGKGKTLLYEGIGEIESIDAK